MTETCLFFTKDNCNEIQNILDHGTDYRLDSYSRENLVQNRRLAKTSSRHLLHLNSHFNSCRSWSFDICLLLPSVGCNVWPLTEQIVVDVTNTGENISAGIHTKKYTVNIN